MQDVCSYIYIYIYYSQSTAGKDHESIASIDMSAVGTSDSAAPENLCLSQLKMQEAHVYL